MNSYERITDVNLNRLSEGLRLIEDVTRFVIDDKNLTEKIKKIRHQIRSLADDRIIESRDSVTDLGRDLNTKDELTRSDWKQMTIAAFKRIQESSRVLEEVYKIPNRDKAIDFKRLRFDLYSLEQEILERLRPFLKKRLPVPLIYLVLSLEHCRNLDPVQIAETALAAGVKTLQLRSKRSADKPLIEIGNKLKELCKKYDSIFIVNDRPDIARIVDADGVHLGQDDIDPLNARKILGPDKIIGISCHNMKHLNSIDKTVVDYAAIGPIFKTSTKERPEPVVGPKLFADLKDFDIPIVAIGGITPTNINELTRFECSRVAVATGITMAEDVDGVVKKYMDQLNENAALYKR